MFTNQQAIIKKVYEHFISLQKGDRIPIDLRAPALVGTVQDDPFDCLVAQELKKAFPELEVISAGKLTTPDLIIRDKATGVIVSIEVKKLIQQKNGADSRGLTMDYNSCLPCGTALINVGGTLTEVACYYLFCLLSNDSKSIVTLILMHGDFINYDFKLHKEAKISNITEYNHGPYGEGSVRRRAMYTYPNPLNYKLSVFHQRRILVEKEYDSRNIVKYALENISHSIQRDDIYGNSFHYDVIDYNSKTEDISNVKDIFAKCKSRESRPRTPAIPCIVA